METIEIVLGLAVGLAVYFIGYLKGLNEGMEWGLRNIREIHADIKRINDELLRRQDAQ
jgi:hypothetical protein